MGACTFANFIRGEDAEKAFRELRTAAEAYYGHNGYTGTIAEKHTFTMIGSGRLSMDEARSITREVLDDEGHQVSDKYGPAGCIKVTGKGGEKGFVFFGWAPE